MKRMKKMMSMVLSLTILLSSATMFMKKAEAIGDVLYDAPIDYLYTKPTNKFEFNPTLILNLYADNSVTLTNYYIDYRHNINEGTIVPLHQYKNRNELMNGDIFSDGLIDARDTSFLMSIRGTFTVKNNSNPSKAEIYDAWTNDANLKAIVYSLVDYLKNEGETISDDDITIVVNVGVPVITDVNDEAIEYTISNKSTLSDAAYEQIKKLKALDNTSTEHVGTNRCQEIVTLTATTSKGAEYKMVIGTDNNWYLLNTKEANKDVSDTKPNDKPATNPDKIKINYISLDKVVNTVEFTINDTKDLNKVVTLIKPSDGDNKFVGWYTDKDLTTKAVVTDVSSLYELKGGYTDKDGVYVVDLYAKWANKSENPKTGVTSLYVSGGVIAASIVLIAVAKKKNLFNKI